MIEKLPLMVLAAASSVITYVIQQQGGAMAPTDRLTLGVRAANALVSYVTYLGKAALPMDLAVFYPYGGGRPAWQVAGAAAILAGLTVFAVWQARRRPYVAVGWFWFLGTLVPVIGLVQVGSQAMADRYTYVPLTGIFIAVVWGAAELVGGRPAARRGAAAERERRAFRLRAALAASVLVAVLAACLLMTVRQVAYWKTGTALFGHAVAVTQTNPLAQCNLGVALIEEGDYAGAVAPLGEALAINPGSHEVLANLGMALSRVGRTDEAVACLQKSLRFNPDGKDALNNLAWIRATDPDSKFRDAFEAVRLAERACSLGHRRSPQMLDTLAAAYAEAGRFQEAVAAAGEAAARAEARGESQLALEIRGRLKLYAANLPYREPAPRADSAAPQRGP